MEARFLRYTNAGPPIIDAVKNRYVPTIFPPSPLHTNPDTYRIHWRHSGYYYVNPDGSHFFGNGKKEFHLWRDGRKGGVEEVKLGDDGHWVVWEERSEPFVDEGEGMEKIRWRVRRLKEGIRRVRDEEGGLEWYRNAEPVVEDEVKEGEIVKFGEAEEMGSRRGLEKVEVKKEKIESEDVRVAVKEKVGLKKEMKEEDGMFDGRNIIKKEVKEELANLKAEYPPFPTQTRHHSAKFKPDESFIHSPPRNKQAPKYEPTRPLPWTFRPSEGFTPPPPRKPLSPNPPSPKPSTNPDSFTTWKSTKPKPETQIKTPKHPMTASHQQKRPAENEPFQNENTKRAKPAPEPRTERQRLEDTTKQPSFMQDHEREVEAMRVMCKVRAELAREGCDEEEQRLWLKGWPLDELPKLLKMIQERPR